MFIDSFIGYLKVERNYSSHTLRAYETDLRLFSEYLAGLDESLSFSDVDDDILRGWIASLMDSESAPASVNRRLSTLRTFYDYLRNEGVVGSNPAVGLRGPKTPKRLPVFVKEEQMDALIDDSERFGAGFSGCRDKAVLVCFYETGMRLSELVGLNLCDVDLSSKQIKVFGKRSRERVIPFATELHSVLKDYLEQRSRVAECGESAFFISDKGVRMSRSSVYRMVTSALFDVTTQKKRSPHVLRHSFATAMLNNDAELLAVKELLGHKNLATTEVYTHLTFEELKRFYKKAHPRAGSN